MRYIGRRLLHGLLLLVGVSLLSFLFADLAPGDYFSGLRADPRVSAAAVAALRGCLNIPGTSPSLFPLFYHWEKAQP